MSKAAKPWSNRLLNIGLALAGIVVVVLLYALVTRTLAPRVDPSRGENPAGLVGEILQVEVRNGCGVAGLAADMTKYLRQKGFDVVEVGDYTSFDVTHSMVIDRVGDLEAAKKIAAVLGIAEAYVRQEISQDYYLDASIVIGQDYTTLTPFQER